MQLNTPPRHRARGARIGAALSAATCSLLAATALPAQAEGAAGDKPWQVDVGLMDYAEQGGRIEVKESTLRLKRQIDEDRSLSVRGSYDMVSGASPSGAVRVQARTAASGTSPLANFSTNRRSFGLDWDAPLLDEFRLAVMADHSQQSAYASSGVGATLSRDANQRNTTYVVGVGYSRDTIQPHGGIHYELQSATTPRIWKASDHKAQADLQLGLTQVLARGTLAQLNYVRSRSAGYMTNPYKIISVVNATTGNPADYDPLTENRPRLRSSNALYGQLNQVTGSGVAYAACRYFWDSWGIKSHTLDLKFRQPLAGRWHVQPHLRHHRQSAADFYRSMLTNTEVADGLPEYASADYRLARLHTTTLGVKAGYRPATGGEVNLRIETLRQDGEQAPADAVGVQRDAGVFPTLRATTLHLSYVLPF